MNIFLTGATGGIGQALTGLLLRQGHRVYAVSREAAALAELRRAVNDEHLFTDVVEVTNETEVRSCLARMQAREYAPDVFVLAAGIFEDDIHPQFNTELFTRHFRTNVGGVMNFVDAYLPRFLKRGRGHFIALSSTTALKPSLRSIGYGASKAALGIAFRGLDLTYRTRHIRFSTLYLGPVATRMWNAKKSFAVMSPEQAAKRIIAVIKNKKSVCYTPFFATLPSRISFLPDRWYIALTELFRS